MIENSAPRFMRRSSPASCGTLAEAIRVQGIMGLPDCVAVPVAATIGQHRRLFEPDGRDGRAEFAASFGRAGPRHAGDLSLGLRHG